jgi:hypothetical protein
MQFQEQKGFITCKLKLKKRPLLKQIQTPPFIF